MSQPAQTKQLIKGIVVCRDSGEYLLDLIFETKVNPLILSSFIGALSLFGKDHLDSIEEVIIRGAKVEIVIVNRTKMIFIAILDKDFPIDNMIEEGEKALEMLYSMHCDTIDNPHSNIPDFSEFKDKLLNQLKDYFLQAKEMKGIKDIAFNMFTDAIKRMKTQNGH